MTVSIREVAKIAGVTHGTVSKVLGGNPKYSIPAPTRQRILSAVGELGYRPHFSAQSLKRGRTNIYGFYAGTRHFEIPNMFFAHTLDGLHAGCNECEKDLMLVGTFRGTDAGALYGALIDGRIDGLVAFINEDDPLCADLVQSPLPVIAIVDPVHGMPSVTIDEDMGASLIASHLAECGHRHVVYVTSYGPMSSALERHAAFSKEADRLGIIVDSFQDDHACEQIVAIMRQSPGARPSAAVCWHDNTARTIYARCHENGIDVPGDLTLIGFDGISRELAPGEMLSTISAPWRAVAREAVHILARRVDGDHVPPITRLSVEFMSGTTG